MNATEIDASRLEEILDEECKCEKVYHDYECTQAVVTKLSFKCDPLNLLVCQSVVTEVQEGYEIGDWCDGCGNVISDCWTIIPV